MYMDNCYLLIFYISILVMKQAHKSLIQLNLLKLLVLKSFQKLHLHVYMYQ